MHEGSDMNQELDPGIERFDEAPAQATQANEFREFGEFTQVDLETVWEMFRSWLPTHLDCLSEKLGISLKLTDSPKEKRALLAEDTATGTSVIIAPQFREADDARLGRVLKTASLLEDGVIVWMASHFPVEYKRTIAWLNTFSPVKFFCVEIKVIRIADSSPVPQLHLILKPGDEQQVSTKEIAP
jgi:hypothetical protein